MGTMAVPQPAVSRPRLSTGAAAQLLLFLPPSPSLDPGWKVQLHNCDAAPWGRRDRNHRLHCHLQHLAGPLCRR